MDQEKIKDKRKSMRFGRLFGFGQHTEKVVKKTESAASKKKSKSSSRSKSKDDKYKSILLAKTPDKEEIQMCTFCDYCDKEIVADFTGQSIIYHRSCHEVNTSNLPLKTNIEPQKSVLKASPGPRAQARSSIDITTNGLAPRDDVTLSMRSPVEDHSHTNNHCDYFTDTETGSYTFSTVDLSSIKRHGISIKTVTTPQRHIVPDTVLTIDGSNRRRRRSKNYSGSLGDDWRMLMDIFNDNDQGLVVEHQGEEVMGKIRVFINLLRPIKILLTMPQSPSMDFFVETTINRKPSTQEDIFWMSRGTTTLLYVGLNCSTTDVINSLLSKFNIKNNPKKFALYEHCVKSPKEVEVCKLRPGQCPLKIMMEWCAKGVDCYHRNLETRRFVLQENDPGSIEWEEFSIPELRSFLRILGQEEEEKKNEIVCKYDILRKEIVRRSAIKRNVIQETESVYL